ncbi:hypothetical protein QSG86_12695 [Acinetobacter sp. SAAs474]|nr:hypothetical protein QSG86_12695 [Acinetobacter sp. SAAs474]
MQKAKSKKQKAKSKKQKAKSKKQKAKSKKQKAKILEPIDILYSKNSKKVEFYRHTKFSSRYTSNNTD